MDNSDFIHNNSWVLESRNEMEKDLAKSSITGQKSAPDGLQSLFDESSAILSNLQQITHHATQIPGKLETNLPVVTIDSETQEHRDSDWQNISAAVLRDIFARLSFHDRLSVSTVGWNWRESFLDNRLCSNPCVTLSFGDSLEIAHSRILANRLARCMRNVTLRRIMNTYRGVFVQVLRQLACNSNLEKLSIDLVFSTDAGVFNADDIDSIKWGQMVYSTVVDIIQRSVALKELMLFGVAHNLAQIASLPDQLSAHQKRHLTHLGLASLLQVQGTSHHRQMPQPLLNLAGCISLTTLTLNYSELTDTLLLSLTGGAMERLVVHVHGWSPNHPGTSDAAWQTFRTNNPHCELRLSILYSDAAIANAHLILQPSMPLTHFKALYCDCTSWKVLQQLALYEKTLRSLVWIDSGHARNYNYFTREDRLGGRFRFFVTHIYLECKSLDEFIYTGHIDNKWHSFICCGRKSGKFGCAAVDQKNNEPYDIDEFRRAIDKITNDANLITMLTNELLDEDNKNLIIMSFVQKDMV